MSVTLPSTPPEVVAANTTAVIGLAKGGAQLIDGLQTANPALYAQLVGSVATYGKSAAAPLVGAALGALVAHFGLGPYVTPDILTIATDALVGLGTAGGALIMHWIGKIPGRALATSGAPTTP